MKRICAVAGSAARPELVSGRTISGIPCSMVRTGWNELGELKLLAKISGKKPRNGRAMGIGL